MRVLLRFGLALGLAFSCLFAHADDDAIITHERSTSKQLKLTVKSPAFDAARINTLYQLLDRSLMQVKQERAEIGARIAKIELSLKAILGKGLWKYNATFYYNDGSIRYEFELPEVADADLEIFLKELVRKSNAFHSVEAMHAEISFFQDFIRSVAGRPEFKNNNDLLMEVVAAATPEMNLSLVPVALKPEKKSLFSLPFRALKWMANSTIGRFFYQPVKFWSERYIILTSQKLFATWLRMRNLDADDLRKTYYAELDAELPVQPANERTRLLLHAYRNAFEGALHNVFTPEVYNWAKAQKIPVTLDLELVPDTVTLLDGSRLYILKGSLMDQKFEVPFYTKESKQRALTVGEWEVPLSKVFESITDPLAQQLQKIDEKLEAQDAKKELKETQAFQLTPTVSVDVEKLASAIADAMSEGSCEKNFEDTPENESVGFRRKDGK